MSDNFNRMRAIQRRRDSGMTYADIGREYGISTERTRQIYMKARKLDGLECDGLYALLREAGKALSPTIGASLRMRAFNQLSRRGITEPSGLRGLSIAEFAGQRNVGVSTVALVAVAKEMVS